MFGFAMTPLQQAAAMTGFAAVASPAALDYRSRVQRVSLTFLRVRQFLHLSDRHVPLPVVKLFGHELAKPPQEQDREAIMVYTVLLRDWHMTRNQLNLVRDTTKLAVMMGKRFSGTFLAMVETALNDLEVTPQDVYERIMSNIYEEADARHLSIGEYLLSEYAQMGDPQGALAGGAALPAPVQALNALFPQAQIRARGGFFSSYPVRFLLRLSKQTLRIAARLDNKTGGGGDFFSNSEASWSTSSGPRTARDIADEDEARRELMDRLLVARTAVVATTTADEQAGRIATVERCSIKPTATRSIDDVDNDTDDNGGIAVKRQLPSTDDTAGGQPTKRQKIIDEFVVGGSGGGGVLSSDNAGCSIDDNDDDDEIITIDTVAFREHFPSSVFVTPLTTDHNNSAAATIEPCDAAGSSTTEARAIDFSSSPPPPIGTTHESKHLSASSLTESAVHDTATAAPIETTTTTTTPPLPLPLSSSATIDSTMVAAAAELERNSLELARGMRQLSGPARRFAIGRDDNEENDDEDNDNDDDDEDDRDDEEEEDDADERFRFDRRRRGIDHDTSVDRRDNLGLPRDDDDDDRYSDLAESDAEHLEETEAELDAYRYDDHEPATEPAGDEHEEFGLLY